MASGSKLRQDSPHVVSCGAAMAHTAAASSSSGRRPQPQRGAGPVRLDLVTMNVGAKQFEETFSKKVRDRLAALGDDFKSKESRSPGYFIVYDLLYS